MAAPNLPAQTSAPQPSQAGPTTQTVAPQQPDPSAPPRGKVLFSRDLNAPDDSSSATSHETVAPNQDDSLAITDAERSALTFTAYDLDVHLTPGIAGLSVRAGLTVRNDGAAPLTRLVFEISSSLHWDAFSSLGAAHADSTAAASPTRGSASLPRAAASPLSFAVHDVDTDADHTGQMEEAVVTLPQPLAPGASIALTALYSGAIPPSAERLERIGAPADQALQSDWDAIGAEGTALRGFGNVLWYPVSEAPVFLGDGAKLFQAVGRAKLRQSAATFRLRLAVDYVGDPPDAAFFCGRREQLIAISDNPNVPAAESPGVATAVFDPQPLGFRTPDLFVTDRAPSIAGPPANGDLIFAVTDHYDALPSYSAAAGMVAPLLGDWFGAQPLTSLTILDHTGQPFEDDALLVRPMRAADPATLAPSLAHSLTHVWIHSSRPWIDEGLAQFAGLLWTERTTGRAAVLAELQDAARLLAIAEPEVPASMSTRASGAVNPPDLRGASSSSDTSAQPPNTADQPHSPDVGASPAGESLAAATGEVFYRTKAAAVWWMLRGIVGDQTLKQALQAYRLDAKLDRDPEGFERTLERFAQMDLRWFFSDWVYLDRGLPDLSIVNVTPRQLEASNGLPAGWLVSVQVRNDGYAEAEVPVTVRSGSATETHRLRVPGRSSASTRIVFAGTPEQVEVNDGSVPETQASVHTRQLVLPGR